MKKHHLFKVHMDIPAALAEAHKVLESGFINEGEVVTQLTTELQRELGAAHLILVNSCTSALTLSLVLAGVQPGDEVVTTSMTCVASNTPIANLGAKIVWADINPLTGMIDANEVRKKITAKTKAVLCVAWAGTPCDLDALGAVCREKGVKLIQDAAHAFGAKYHGRPISEFADYTCFSFQAIKHFTTGDGGALVCRSEADYKQSKKLKWFGLDRDATKDEKGNWKGQQWDVDVDVAGFKFNMNNLTAAIGVSQIPHIPKILNGHRDNARVYDHAFQNQDLVMPLQRQAHAESSFWVYTALIRKPGVNRDKVLEALNREGIMAGLVHVPNHPYTAFKSSYENLPGVDHFGANQISLPCGWWLSKEDVQFIADRVTKVVRDS